MAQMYKYSASSSTSIAALNKTAPSQADLIGAKDPTGLLKPLEIDASGRLKVTLSGASSFDVNAYQAGVWNITDITGTVSLPTGASTEAKQDSAISLLTTIDADTSVLAGAVSGSEMQVDVVSSALPAGAATEATLLSISSDTANISGDTANIAISTTNIDSSTTSINSKIPSLGQSNMAGSTPVVIASDQSAILVAQSGTWDINDLANITGTISLPTGAATEATLLAVNGAQTDGTQKTQIVDGSGNVISSTSNALDVYVTGGTVTAASPSVSATAAAVPAQATYVAGDKAGVLTGVTLDSASNLNANVQKITGIIDANNTTSTPLGIGGNFTGAWTELTDYNSVNLGVFSDVGSATDGLRIEYSADGVSVHHYHLWTFAGGVNGVGYQLATEFRYFRINYTNGAVAQTTFQLISNLKPTALTPSSYRVSQTFSSQSQVQLTKGVIVGESTGGGGAYVNVKVAPSGALTTESTLAGLDAAVLGQDTMANSLPVVLASNQTAIPVTDNGSSLTVDGTISATQSGTWNINNVSGTVSLPTGAATETTLSALNTKVPANLTVSSTRLLVDGSGVTQPVSGSVGITGTVLASVSGTGSANAPVYNNYASTNVTTSAYVQLVASTSNAINNVHIFDSSGQAMILAIGGAGSEVDTLYVPPGGDTYNLNIPVGSRISYKALTATASSGYLLMSFLK